MAQSFEERHHLTTGYVPRPRCLDLESETLYSGPILVIPIEHTVTQSQNFTKATTHSAFHNFWCDTVSGFNELTFIIIAMQILNYEYKRSITITIISSTSVR